MAVKAGRQMSSSTDSKEQKPSPPPENNGDEEETNVKSKYGNLHRYLKRTNSLTQSNIKMFARSLRLDDTEFDSINFAYEKYGLHEIKYQVVSQWKSKHGEEATDEWFAHSLDEVGLKDEAEHFRQGTSKRPMEETGSPGGVSDFKDNLPCKHLQSSHPYTSLDSCVSRESPPLKDIPQAEQGSSSPADAQAQQSTVEQQTSVQSWDLRIWILTVLMAILAFVVATYSLYHEQYAVTIIVVAVAAVFCLVFLVLTLKVTQNYADAPVELRKPPELFSAAHDKCLDGIKRSFEEFKRSPDYNHGILFQVLHGLGGCGKTEIVSSYAWNNWQRYTGGVFVLNGQSNSYIDFGFKKILEKMKMDLSNEEKTPNNIRRSVLNKLNERKDWLLIIDDADDPELLWQVLETPKPLSEGHILVTSRVKTVWDELSTNKIKKIQIEPLSEDDSAILLLRLTTLHQSKPLSLRETKRNLKRMSSKNPAEYRAIMWLGGEQALHGLPLALKLASRYVAEHHISFQTYKNLYLTCNLDVLPASTSEPLTGWLKRHGLNPSYAVGLRSVVGKETINIMSLDEKQLQEGPINLSGTDLTKFREAIRETNKSDFVKMADLDKENIVKTWSINYNEIKKESHTTEFLQLCSCLSSRIQVALFIDGAKYLNIGDLREFFIPRSLSGRYHGKENIHMKVLKLFKTLENVSFATNIVGSEEEEEHKRSLSREGEYTIHHVLQQVVFLHFMSHEEKIKSFNSALSILEMLFPKQEKFEDFRTMLCVIVTPSLPSTHLLSVNTCCRWTMSIFRVSVTSIPSSQQSVLIYLDSDGPKTQKRFARPCCTSVAYGSWTIIYSSLKN
ncbi:uncharacterized protein [Ptychodera flava]|uniref:uncharacterized protein isoform X2 n=1 Tax=Ptychodera flava TaxID=63121 RepID=UPI00396A2D1C